VEECDRNITRVLRNIKMLYDMEAPDKKVVDQDAELKVWKSIKHHIEHGIILTMNSEGVLHQLAKTTPH
jgi:hypothetical protein